MGLLNPFETISDFVSDPVGTVYREVTQPLRDAVDVLDGLSEGELRIMASARLGADVVSGMALSEIIDYLRE